jgi:hypothetical protein
VSGFLLDVAIFQGQAAVVTTAAAGGAVLPCVFASARERALNSPRASAPQHRRRRR